MQGPASRGRLWALTRRRVLFQWDGRKKNVILAGDGKASLWDTLYAWLLRHSEYADCDGHTHANQQPNPEIRTAVLVDGVLQVASLAALQHFRDGRRSQR